MIFLLRDSGKVKQVFSASLSARCSVGSRHGKESEFSLFICLNGNVRFLLYFGAGGSGFHRLDA